MCVGRDSAIIRKLGEMHDRETVLELKFLLDHVGSDVVRDFVRSFMMPAELAQQASVTIIVRQLAVGEKPRGNIGRYVVCTQKEGFEPMVLRFANKASTIFYMMCLIERCQNEHPTAFDLQRNQGVFVDIYRMVYDNLREADVAKLCERLCYREVDGRIRCGRLKATICDIRTQLSQHFDIYGESYKPYATTADTHICVPQSKIVFEGEAAKLLLKKIA